jgi:hypothetical protein
VITAITAEAGQVVTAGLPVMRIARERAKSRSRSRNADRLRARSRFRSCSSPIHANRMVRAREVSLVVDP